MKTILIVDDDVHIGNLLAEALSAEGYGVMRAYSGTEALLALSQATPDLVLLDLMLPGLCGEELLPKIRNIPVIVLSAKVDTDSKVSLLLGGAADYVTKPFHIRELLARIAVQLRAAVAGDHAPVLSLGTLTLRTDAHLAQANGREIHLTRTEYAILKLLMQNHPQIVSKSTLLDRIGADTPDCTESSLKTHISHLRAKLAEGGGRDYIETVWGIGFRMREG